MLPGPVFNVELLTTARRPRYFVMRVLYGLALLYLLWVGFQTRSRYNEPVMSIQSLSRVASTIFEAMTALQVGSILLIVPALVAGVIAEEKQRKTLHYLLASQLSSSEIILGKLLARMLHVVVLLSVGLPVLSILSLAGGIDPRMIVLAFAASLSMGYFLASIAIFCSTAARKVRQALMMSYVLELFWLVAPGLIATTAFSYPNFYRAIEPLNDWLIRSTPWTYFRASFQTRGDEFAAIRNPILIMCGLQVAVGSLFVLLAIFRLRPIFRNQEGSSGIRAFRIFNGKLSPRWRINSRHQVGDEAMLWKEMHTSRTTGIVRLVANLIGLGIVVAVVFSMFPYARDAWIEMRQSGYFNRGFERTTLNGFVRVASTFLASLTAISAAMGGASAMTSEREDDTWISLVATPLSGQQIVLGKIVGVLWRTRFALGILLMLWLLGMVCGAIHPLALLLEAIEVGVFVSFAAVLGVAMSLRSKSTWKSQSITLALLLFINGGYLLCLCPVGAIMTASGPSPFLNSLVFLVLAPVTPFIETVTLMTPWELNELGQSGRGWGPNGQLIGMVLACVAGTLGYGFAAVMLAARTIARFDMAADRPIRSSFAVQPPKAKPKTREPLI